MDVNCSLDVAETCCNTSEVPSMTSALRVNEGLELGE